MRPQRDGAASGRGGAQLGSVPLAARSERRLLVVTDTPFWLGSRGSHQRIVALLRGLEGRGYTLGVWVIGSVGQAMRRRIRQRWPGVVFRFAERWMLDRVGGVIQRWTRLQRPGLKRLSLSLEDFHQPELSRRFAKALAAWRPHVVILEYASLGWLSETVRGVDGSCRVAIDTHDVLSERAAAFAARGWSHWLEVTASQEREALSGADCLVAIQAEDQRVFREWFPEAAVLVAGHPVEAGVSGDGVSGGGRGDAIGLIGGRGPANQEGMRWFLEEVWGEVVGRVPTARLCVAGELGQGPVQRPGGGSVEFLGRVDRLPAFYGGLSIAVNPTTIPSGLKIKSVEAVGYGVPLVTTSQGAVGLEPVVGRGVQVADEPCGFADAIVRWLGDGCERALAARSNREFAAECLTEGAVYGELFSWIELGGVMGA